MTEPKSTVIHETEWDLLEVLWEAERATARQVAEALAEKRGWANSTVKTLLDRMVQKGLLHARQVGNVWEYSPALPQTQARRAAWSGFVDKAFGGAMGSALEFLASDARLTKKQRETLRALLDDVEADHE